MSEREVDRNWEILEMRRRGALYREIGSRYGISRGRVGQIVERYGSRLMWRFRHLVLDDYKLRHKQATGREMPWHLSDALRCKWHTSLEVE